MIKKKPHNYLNFLFFLKEIKFNLLRINCLLNFDLILINRIICYSSLICKLI
jgi:hypothetical protein